MKKAAGNGKRPKKLPGNHQAFMQIISDDKLYADKTPYIYKMAVESDFNCLFLSRPGRFGKTLLLDTLNELFSGRRHLFENLWIGLETGYDFQPHPVIRLSMNCSVTDSPEKLKNYIIKDLLEDARTSLRSALETGIR
jgi:hypothetical protein